MLPRNFCHQATLNVASQLLPPNCCHRAAPNVASQMLPATTRRRRDDDDATTTTTTTRRRGSGDGVGESLHPQVPSPSLQVSSALTVAAAPKRPRSRCSLCGDSPQALPVSWAPCSPSSRCSPLTPHSAAAAPRRPSVTAPKRTLTVPRPSQSLQPRGRPAAQAVAAQSPQRPMPSQSLQPHGPHCSSSLLIQEDG